MSEPPRPVFPAAAGIQTPTWVGSVLGDQNRPGFPGSWVPVATATTGGVGKIPPSFRPPPPRPPHPSFRRKPESTRQPGREGRANPKITKIKRITVQDNPPPHSPLRTPNSKFPHPPSPQSQRVDSSLRPTTETAEAGKGRGARFSSGRRGRAIPPPVIPAPTRHSGFRRNPRTQTNHSYRHPPRP